MIIVTRNEEYTRTLSLKFKYFKNYIDRVRALGGEFDKESKSWLLGLNLLPSLEREFEGELYFKTPRWELLGEKPPVRENIYKLDNPLDVSTLNLKLPLFKYQKYGVQFLVDRLAKYKMAFISDGMGLGKTFQAIATIEHFLKESDINDILVVCKKSLKYQWQEEFEKFTDTKAKIFVVPETKAKRLKAYKEINSYTGKKIVITNYHTVLADEEFLSCNMVVYDECHSVKNHKGKINRACARVTKSAKYCLFMTGTPLMSNPSDLYGIVSIKDPKYFAKSYKAFTDRYITISYDEKYPQEVGYKNIDELRSKIQSLILRRTSDEVDIDMPSVIVHDVFLERDKYQEKLNEHLSEKMAIIDARIEVLYNKLKADPQNEEISKEIKAEETKLKGFLAIEQIVANNPKLIEKSKSQSIRTGYKSYIPPDKYISSKYVKFLSIIEDAVESGEKVVVFSKYETVISDLRLFLTSNKIQSVTCHGGLDSKTRNEVIKEFKTNDDVKVIIATDALSEGANLQNSSIVVNFDLAYNDSINQQRIGRSRRVGAKHKRTVVYNLLTKKTIDESILTKVNSTKRDFDAFVSVDSEQSKMIKRLSN